MVVDRYDLGGLKWPSYQGDANLYATWWGFNHLWRSYNEIMIEHCIGARRMCHVTGYGKSMVADR